MCEYERYFDQTHILFTTTKDETKVKQVEKRWIIIYNFN